MLSTIILNKFLKEKKLKGKNISITENLSGYRMSVLNKARGKFGFNNEWTYDGRILYKVNNGGKRWKSMNNIYFEALMVTVKMGKKIRSYIVCYSLIFLLFSVRGSGSRTFISGKFRAFGNAPLMLKIICKTLLIPFLFCNFAFSLYTLKITL